MTEENDPQEVSEPVASAEPEAVEGPTEAPQAEAPKETTEQQKAADAHKLKTEIYLNHTAQTFKQGMMYAAKLLETRVENHHDPKVRIPTYMFSEKTQKLSKTALVAVLKDVQKVFSSIVEETELETIKAFVAHSMQKVQQEAQNQQAKG